VRLWTRIALLTALWLLAWGEVSLANIVSGVVVSAAILLALPPTASQSAHARIDLVGSLRLVAYVAAQLVTSNVLMAREVLRPHTTTEQGVLAHRLQSPSEHVVTVMTSVISLSPGTMVVDVDRTSSTVYVHVLFLHDIEAARRSLVRLEQVARATIRSAAVPNPVE